MELPEFLVDWGKPGEPDIRVRGSRIGLVHLIQDYRLGESVEELAVAYEVYGPDTIRGIFAWYFQNREAVDAYVAEEEAACERHHAEWAGRGGPTMADIRERFRNKFGHVLTHEVQ